MKKFIVCLFIGLFILIGYTIAYPASPCPCCGASRTQEPMGHYHNSCSCSSFISICSNCDLCSRHCTCCDCCGDDDCSDCYGSIHSCGYCRKHCDCTPPCSFVNTCSKEHCKIKVCSDCGKHKNDATCGGGCNNDGYCSHCNERYCDICDNHKCTHGPYKNCSQPHCSYSEGQGYCVKCKPHPCDGGHRFGTLTCSFAHCDDLICTVSGCNVHKTGKCGGDHTQGIWKEEGLNHNRYCGRTDLSCSAIIEYHGIYWLQADANHTSICSQNCGLTYTHEPVWPSEYITNGSSHVRQCAVVLDNQRCSAIDSHASDWSEFVKADNGGESSGADHLRRCNFAGCNLEYERHVWPNDSKWHPINEDEHKRICTTCSLTQTKDHKFYYEAIPDNIINHYKICEDCVNQDDSTYKLEKQHVDTEYEGRGNGICDLCNKELWRVTFSTEELTRDDITIKVEIFSDCDDDKIELPVKMTDKDGNEYEGNDGRYTVGENGLYYFHFESPDRVVDVEIRNISKNIHGRIAIDKTTPTTGSIKLTFLVGDDGIKDIYGTRKSIGLKYQDDSDYNWDIEAEDPLADELVYKMEKEISNIGRYTFWARDSLGNEREFVIDVNNIVTGFGSVTTTYDAFVGGSIFTDILVNVNSSCAFSSEIIKNLEGKIKCYKVNDNENTGSRYVDINKVQIADERGNIIFGNELKHGTYYLKVAIGGKYKSGGANVFETAGTYMLELEEVTIDALSDVDVTLAGKNRIEVVVRDLNDLT